MMTATVRRKGGSSGSEGEMRVIARSLVDEMAFACFAVWTCGYWGESLLHSVFSVQRLVSCVQLFC